ncbi:GerAB/ArcD/ProY family transporter [Filobacillus milosensis]|uniref:GerAB/ArcD/ProY family transporter n=1 Tax=Filobacillus milosensis TaxID=94137 RepID=UPI001890CDF0|nr:GerAB/ArcD/ProY family transporter [Filobacillus milosensis]
MKELQRQINPKYKVSGSLAFFLICSIQIGVGVLGFQTSIVERVGNDSWIPVLLAGLMIHFLIWMIYKILKFGNGDLITIHYDVFGRWIGGLFSFVWIIYFWTIGVIVLRTYLQVIQVWMFQEINIIVVTLIFSLLLYYLITGGFRVVVGVCFLGTVIPSYLIFSLFYTMDYTNFKRLLPVWNHSTTDILLATQEMTFSFIGFTVLLMYYPYLKKANKTKLWGHGGNFLTLCLYIIIMVFSLAYYTKGHLLRQKWPTLTMWKSIELPFVERFEYIGISSWALIILPNICLAFWAASRGARQLFRFSQRKALIIMLSLNLLANYLIKTQKEIETINKLLSQFAFYLFLIYIPFLFIFSYLRLGRRKQHD